MRSFSLWHWHSGTAKGEFKEENSFKGLNFQLLEHLAREMMNDILLFDLLNEWNHPG